ncbi:2Fe-2S iron-sulfur cluster-binding protein [Streptomyces sp. NPDC001708]
MGHGPRCGPGPPPTAGAAADVGGGVAVHAGPDAAELTCATCETALLDGAPGHRDSLLNEDERASGGALLICVCRVRGPGWCSTSDSACSHLSDA